MKHHNLKDPKVVDTPRRVRSIETMSPIGFSSVERGGLRIASDQGLLVEGQAHVTGLLSGTGELDWAGPGTFTGDVEAQKFSAGVGAFKTTFDNRGFTSVGTGTRGAIGGGGEQSFSYEGSLNGGGFRFKTTGEFQSDAWFGAGSVRVSNLPSASAPNSMNVLLANADGEFYKGPVYGGVGGDDWPIGPGDPGDPSGTGLKWPFPLSTMTSDFGYRSSPGGVGSTYHQGIDLGRSCGTPVPCAGPGTVIYRGYLGSWGNYVRVDHGGGIWTAYAHMSGFSVSVGQTVNQRQTLGYVGTTGSSTGCHLHYEVWVNGGRVNPRGYTS